MTTEAIVDGTSDKSPNATRRYRRPALTWIDFLVIAAIVLTFAAIVSSTLGRARAADRFDPPTYSTEVSQVSDDPGLIRAKVRLAVGAPWS